MAKVINLEAQVIVPTDGRHFHLMADCRTLNQGWNNNEKHGHVTFVPTTMTYGEAVDAGKYGCITCHKAFGVDVPVVASLHAARAANAARRAARKAQREADAAMKIAMALAAKAAALTTQSAEIDELVAV
jgi:protein-arginine kinase activator protein McsA